MQTSLFVTGASTGIGAALLSQVPETLGQAHTFSRTPSAGRWVAADLSGPGGWAVVCSTVERALDAERPSHAVFLHCAGTSVPVGRLTDLSVDEHAGAVLLNSASGPVLGQMFLAACSSRGIRATLVLVGSPAAGKDVPGMAHYCAGKDGMQHWARIAALEVPALAETRVITVVPYAVLTDVVRSIMTEDPAEVPLVNYFREVERAGEFAPPQLAAEQIWAAVESAPNGATVPVGALVIADRATASSAGNSP
jgi:benzil reductase ((S)-benzoin forming)